MTTIASGATPYFGSNVPTPKRSFRYHYPDKIHLGRLERLKAYGSGTHWKAGYDHAYSWFKSKSAVGKVVALATLGTAWFLDTFNMIFAGVWTASKFLYPNANLSGLGRAFHYGVQKSYELSKVAK